MCLIVSMSETYFFERRRRLPCTKYVFNIRHIYEGLLIFIISKGVTFFFKDMHQILTIFIYFYILIT